MKIVFEWLDTDVNILGIKRYIPICEHEIRKKDGTWVPFIFKIDSRADTVLMKESDCRVLGYSLTDCEQVEFDTASEKSVKTRVQMLDVRISGYVIEQPPIAFSASPIKMLLLGRAKLFETLDICFLHEQKNTVFTS